MAYSIGPLRYNPSGAQLAILLDPVGSSALKFGRRLVYDPAILGPLYDPYAHSGGAHSQAKRLLTFGHDPNATDIRQEFRGLWKRLRSGIQTLKARWKGLFQGPQLSPQGVPVRVDDF